MDSTKRPVRVWLLLGKYGGDNAQVLGLGEHLAAAFGWQCETRRVKFLPDPPVPRLKIPTSIDFGRSESFDPPWPDVVIACGRFYGAVAAWLKRGSGGALVHVQLGRIAAPMASFDLLAAPAQYGLPQAANFLPLTLPIVRRDQARIDAGLAGWRSQFERLPRPLTAVLIGGPISQIRLGADEAHRLIADACAEARRDRGALGIAFGKRTPKVVRTIVTEALAASDIPHVVFGWPAPEPNPYPALLALADRFRVTSDSASMIADACMTGRPVDLIRLPIADFLTRLSSRGLGLSIDARRRRRGRAGLPADVLDRFRDSLVRRYWMRPWDEMRDFLDAVERAGLVGCGATDRGKEIQSREIAALAMRIAALVAARGTQPQALRTFPPARFATTD